MLVEREKKRVRDGETEEVIYKETDEALGDSVYVILN